MHIKNFIILLALFFSQLLFADDLNDYKYENYKANAVEISFTSILPKMRAEMYDGKEISGLMYKPDGSGPFEAVVMLHGAGGIFPYQLDWARQLND